ncbi:MAG: hypothetical protein AAF329_19590, partial [Cyanobacteria bacterium P01_A01_bin.17]
SCESHCGLVFLNSPNLLRCDSFLTISSFLPVSSNGIKAEDIRTDNLTGKQFTFFQDPDGLPLELYER